MSSPADRLADALRLYVEDYMSEDGTGSPKGYVRIFNEALAAYEASKAVPPPPKLTYTGGWWAITGARLIVESIHPVGYTTHRELDNAERKKWAEWFKALKDAT